MVLQYARKLAVGAAEPLQVVAPACAALPGLLHSEDAAAGLAGLLLPVLPPRDIGLILQYAAYSLPITRSVP